MRLLPMLFILASLGFAQDCIHCVGTAQASAENTLDLPWDPLVKIRFVDYKRNPKAIYCKRKEDLVDTIVFHHSEGPATQTAEQIHNYHYNQGTAADPWLMIAYHYVMNIAYPGTTKPAPLVTQGRPFDIVGSHAGTDAFRPVSDETKAMMSASDSILCGNSRTDFAPPLDKFNARGEGKGNYSTVAIVVSGNYAPQYDSRGRMVNAGGYPRGRKRFLTAEGIELAAKLSCQIQREHPRVKEIKWHNFYKPTSCPGSIEETIGAIKEAARKYGCNFN